VNEERSTRYNRLQRQAALLSGVIKGVIVMALLSGGASLFLRKLAVSVTKGTASDAGTVAIYVLLVFAIIEVATLPVGLYRTFVLERRYGLSSESFTVWAADHLKALAITLVVALAAAEVVYFSLERWPRWWWLVSTVAFIAAMVVVARITPVVLLPVFYRFRPLDRPALQKRLVSLSERAGLPVLGVFEWGLGEKTRRANAALVGTGRTRRILLSDTLLAEYTDDEIEVILAHELGHHAHRDIQTGLLVESALIATSFAVAATAQQTLWRFFRFDGPADVAGLPLLVLVAGILSLAARPAFNALSRRNEHRADQFALTMTERPDAFVSAMRRLAAQNLAEERPSAATLWLFHSHPPFEQRIQAARAFIS
jgi:Zn-dependent protease with chaperone function